MFCDRFHEQRPGGTPILASEEAPCRRWSPVQYSRSLDFISRGAVVVVLCALGCTGTPLCAQEIYKSVDAEGHVVYSDRASTKNASKSTLHVDEPDPAEAARLAKQQKLLETAAAQRVKQDAADAKSKAAEDERRQKACEKARNNYLRLKDSGRLFHRDADGNRVYYSDEEIDAMREQARRAMTAACGS